MLLSKINEYFILPGYITQEQLKEFMGRIVKVTGKLRVVEGRMLHPKSSIDGTIYEPYKEPDKKYPDDPVFEIIGN